MSPTWTRVDALRQSHRPLLGQHRSACSLANFSLGDASSHPQLPSGSFLQGRLGACSTAFFWESSEAA